MLAISPTVYNVGRRVRTYRQRKKINEKPCMTKVERLECAIRHKRCQGCPYNDFFKSGSLLKKRISDNINGSLCKKL